MKVIKNEQGNFDIFRTETQEDAITGESLEINKKVFSNLELKNAENHLNDAQEMSSLWGEIVTKMKAAE